MTPATFPLDRADTPLFADGLGERVLAADATTADVLAGVEAAMARDQHLARYLA